MSETTTNLHEYSVSELSSSVKNIIEDNFSRVRVRGELGRVVRAGSGHMYMDLKDDRAVINGVIWKGNASRLKIDPEQGMEVVATGRMTTYPGQSRYQIIIDSLEPAGVGALMALFEKRKKQLEAEGLFAPERKKTLPFLPKVIGVVTSPSGAVIRDILHRLRERYPAHVLVWPTLVQGKEAEAQIVKAIKGFNSLPAGGSVPRPDLLIVARGGGSLEDLWCFNEETVARAAAGSDIPLISAVGHETDTTLIDYVADKRAPTPTAAAEMATPVRADLISELLNKERRLLDAQSRLMETLRSGLRAAERGLGRPDEILGTHAQRFDRAGDRLNNGLRSHLETASTVLARTSGRFSPSILNAGFEAREGRMTRAKERLHSGMERSLERRKDRINSIRLVPASLSRRVADARPAVDSLAARLTNTTRNLVNRREQSLNAIEKLLASLSHHNVLARGFALIRDESGNLVRSHQAISPGSQGEVEFFDGRQTVTFSDKKSPIKPQTKSRAGNRPPNSKKDAAPQQKMKATQKSLFDE